MLEDEVFSTQDLGLASFLQANNLKFKEIRMTEGSKNICEFCFEAPEGNSIPELLQKWVMDPEVKFLKRLLFSNKSLKKELKTFLIGYHNNRIDEETL